MTQLQELANAIERQNKKLDEMRKEIDTQFNEMAVAQDVYLAAKTKLTQTRVKYDGLVTERDQNLVLVRDLSRVVLGEIVPLHGDPNAD